MFTRSILLPTLAACVIAAPFLFSSAEHVSDPHGNPTLGMSNELADGAYGDTAGVFLGTGYQASESGNVFRQTGASKSYQNAPFGDPAFQASSRNGDMTGNPALRNQGTPVVYGPPGSTMNVGSQMSLEEIFRFSIDANWIKQRWSRVSTTSGTNGLHGFRVALVTGTNPWDLHGSLTYFFDENQQVQRIAFRGWTGDASQLLDLLTRKYNFKSQPTHWAGYYVSKSWGRIKGGLLMQNPPVIQTDNLVEQVAVVLEMNNYGKFSLSDEFELLIEGSRSAR